MTRSKKPRKTDVGQPPPVPEPARVFRLSEHAQVRMHVVARCLADMAHLAACNRFDLHPPSADVAALASELVALSHVLWRETSGSLTLPEKIALLAKQASKVPPHDRGLCDCTECENWRAAESSHAGGQ